MICKGDKIEGCETMGRVLPILFNTDMVQAILDGRKTVTRRVISHVKIEDVLNSPVRIDNPDIPDQRFISCLVDSPYEPGDILYVRETWRTIAASSGGWCKIEYRTGGTEEFDKIVALPIRKGRWRRRLRLPTRPGRCRPYCRCWRIKTLKKRKP